MANTLFNKLRRCCLQAQRKAPNKFTSDCSLCWAILYTVSGIDIQKEKIEQNRFQVDFRKINSLTLCVWIALHAVWQSSQRCKGHFELFWQNGLVWIASRGPAHLLASYGIMVLRRPNSNTMSGLTIAGSNLVCIYWVRHHSYCI